MGAKKKERELTREIRKQGKEVQENTSATSKKLSYRFAIVQQWQIDTNNQEKIRKIFEIMGTNVFPSDFSGYHVYRNFKQGYICRITVNFGT